jgi:prepilin signal peptidase PulO-like enzyme (type II secretory pathway)
MMYLMTTEFGLYAIGIAVIVFLLGVSIGSFLNAVVFRVRDDKTVVKSRSRCRSCKVDIEVGDLIPVVSYVRLKGKCRNCKEEISWQYPVVEIVMGLLFVIAFFHAESLLYFVRDATFLSFLMIIFVYDLRYMLILDKFTFPAMIIAIVLNLWIGSIDPLALLIGGIGLALFFNIQYLASKGTWVGGGDIRMGALMGFMLGLGYGSIALFLAYVMGAIVGVGIILAKKGDRKTPIPFGTFLAAATAIVLFVGPEMLSWYLSLFI